MDRLRLLAYACDLGNLCRLVHVHGLYHLGVYDPCPCHSRGPYGASLANGHVYPCSCDGRRNHLVPGVGLDGLYPSRGLEIESGENV